MSYVGSGDVHTHGERSASESDAKKDRESVGQAPANSHSIPIEADREAGGAAAWVPFAEALAQAVRGPHEVPDAAALAAAPAPGGLPCLPSEQLNWKRRESGGRIHRASAQRLILEVHSMARRWGVEKMGMLTLGFADPAPNTIKEASRRFNSLATNAKFSQRYSAWLAVIERAPKTGRLHFHLVVVMPGDIRTGFSHEEIKRQDYSSACPLLKAEWSFLRHNVTKYGFGGYVQLTPVKSDVDGFAGYLAKYLVKEFGTRRGDKGARLVRYSKGWKTVHGPFSWIGDRKRKIEAQKRLEEMGKTFGFQGEYGAEKLWGAKWKFHLARTLYCRTDLYLAVLTYTERSLEIYDGVPFALSEAWAYFDSAN